MHGGACACALLYRLVVLPLLPHGAENDPRALLNEVDLKTIFDGWCTRELAGSGAWDLWSDERVGARNFCWDSVAAGKHVAHAHARVPRCRWLGQAPLRHDAYMNSERVILTVRGVQEGEGTQHEVYIQTTDACCRADAIPADAATHSVRRRGARAAHVGGHSRSGRHLLLGHWRRPVRVADGVEPPRRVAR